MPTPITSASHPLGSLVNDLMGQAPVEAADKLSPAFAGLRGAHPVLPKDVLQFGKRRFGNGASFGEIREVKTMAALDEKNLAGVVAKASALTKDNGFDEIFFLGEDKKLYVLFVEKGRLEDVRVGFLGRANVGGRQQSVEVLAVEDENNTFYQGMMATWKWLHTVLVTSFGTEASKSVSGLVTTAIGSFVAAAALKTTTAAPAAAGAAGAAASTAAGGFLKTVGTSFGNAMSGFAQTLASMVLFAVGAVGVFSIYVGIKGHYKKGDRTTIDMITGRY